MTVKIINPDEVKDLFKHWGEFSKVCYNTQNVAPEKIGKHCLNSGHFSGSRTRYIELEISGVSRAIIDQLVRHEQGVVKNVQSTRYVDKSGLICDIPVEILGNRQLYEAYEDHMFSTSVLYREIQKYVLEKTGSQERANEQARTILPMGVHTSVTIGMTLEALIHYMNVRLCTRAEKEHRDLAKAIKKAVLEVLPYIEEWLVPQCQALLYCPEAHGCGQYLSRKETIARLKAVNEEYNSQSNKNICKKC